MVSARRNLRRCIRTRRRRVTPGRRQAAAYTLARRIAALPEFHRAQRIAIYLAFDGELPLDEMIRRAQSRGKHLYAPRLGRSGQLEFVALESNTAARSNAYGIAEPTGRVLINPRRLDLVLTPLVAFDAYGTRLGMGGGHYDRSFHFLLHRRHWLRPKLIGVGYRFQQVPVIRRQPWDIPLWAAVTDRSTVRFEPQ